MYEVKLINDDKEVIINAVNTSRDSPRITGSIKRGINTINSFEFEILPNNPGYNCIVPKKSQIEVFNTKKNKYEFRGRVLLPSPSMDSNGVFYTSVVCESELGYLHDSFQRYGEYHNISVRDFLSLMIDKHNSEVEEYKQFILGEVTVEDNNDSLYRYLDYDSTFNMIQDKLINRLGGELRVRYENGKRYLDYVKEIGEEKNTEIRLSKNLVSIDLEKDPTQIITKLIPLGAKLNDTEERLTIKEVNDNRDYILDEDAIEVYGINEGVITFDDVTTAINLLEKGKAYLNQNNRIQNKFKIKALDLSLIGLDFTDFEEGNSYRIINPVMGIDEVARIKELTINIANPEESDFTIGDKFYDIKESISNNEKVEKNLEKTVTTAIDTVDKRVTNVSNEVESNAKELKIQRNFIIMGV